MIRPDHILFTFTLLLGLAAGACSDDAAVQRPLPAPSSVEIMPQAGLPGSRADLSGAQDGPQFPASTDGVFAVSAYLSPTDFDQKYFINQPVRSDADSTYHFYPENGLRYYPEDGSPLYFRAYSPVHGIESADARTVTWRLTGQEDIMYASDLTGLTKITGDHLSAQPQPNFRFKHLLTRFNIYERWGNGFPDKMVITEVKLLDCEQYVELNLEDGKLSPKDVSQNKTDFYCNVNKEIDNLINFDYLCTFMCMPTKEMRSIWIEVMVSDVKYGPAEIIAPDNSPFAAGYSYNIKLEFESNRLIIATTVQDWEDGGSSLEGNFIF